MFRDFSRCLPPTPHRDDGRAQRKRGGAPDPYTPNELPNHLRISRKPAQKPILTCGNSPLRCVSTSQGKSGKWHQKPILTCEYTPLRWSVHISGILCDSRQTKGPGTPSSAWPQQKGSLHERDPGYAQAAQDKGHPPAAAPSRPPRLAPGTPDGRRRAQLRRAMPRRDRRVPLDGPKWRASRLGVREVRRLFWDELAVTEPDESCWLTAAGWALLDQMTRAADPI